MLPYVFISVSYCCGGSGGIARSYLRCSFTSFRFSSIVDTQLSRLSLGSLFFAWLIMGQPLAVGMKGLIFDSRMIWHTGVICVAVKHAQITIPIGVKCAHVLCLVFAKCGVMLKYINFDLISPKDTELEVFLKPKLCPF